MSVRTVYVCSQCNVLLRPHYFVNKLHQTLSTVLFVSVPVMDLEEILQLPILVANGSLTGTYSKAMFFCA